jgi:Tol biopolymer transport system component
METGQISEIIPSPNFSARMGYFYSLIWGPDAKSLIVAAVGNTPSGYGVFKVDAQTGTTSLILNSDTFIPRLLMISPDGRTLYYLRIEPTDQVKLIKRDLASGSEVVLSTNALLWFPQPLNGLGLSLSPDGGYLKGVATDVKERPLLLISTADGATRQLASGAGPGMFSPDSRYIASLQPDAATKSRVAMLFPLAGGQPRELTRFPDTVDAGVVMWTADNKSVFLRTVEGKRIDFWRVSIDGGKPQKLDFPDAHNNDFFLLSPNGRNVAISHQPPRTERKPPEVWIMENLFPKIAKK